MAIYARSGRITTTNTSLTTFTTADADYTDLVTGSNQGTIVDEITVNSSVNDTQAGTLRLFIYDTTETPVATLHSQYAIPATTRTPNTGQPTYSLVLQPLNLKLHHNQVLRATFATSSVTAIAFHLTASVTNL